MSMAKTRNTQMWEYQSQGLATTAEERSGWTCQIGFITAAMLVAGLVGYAMGQSGQPMLVRAVVVAAVFFGLIWASRKFCPGAQATAEADTKETAPAKAPAARAAPAPAPKLAPAAKPTPVAKAAPAPEPLAPEPAAEMAPEDVGSRPEALSAARDGKADDLKLIKGVGPKLEQLCNKLGFYHFDQISAWTADEVAWVDQNLEGFKGRVSRDDWVAQAKILAEGGETEFSKRQS